MLYNLDWLKEGEQFPPKSEVARLQRYQENKKLFNSEHHDVYKHHLERIERVIGNMSDIISYPVILNFQRNISLKTADLLFCEPPIFKTKDEKKQATIDEIVEESDLRGIGYEGAIDGSRYGTAAYKVDNENNKGKITISSPELLFTVVAPDNRKKVTHYVLAWTYREGKETYLKATIHSKGSYRTLLFEMNGRVDGDNGSSTIGRLIEDSEEVKTNVSDFAVIPIHNVLTSDSVYGSDDYTPLDCIIAELMVRLAQVSKILDVHASPTMSGSKDALEPDGEGGYTFKAGKFYDRADSNEPPLEYITWEANLEANFEQIEKLLNLLAVISEMGPAIFNSDLKTGSELSGTALKKLYINPLAKVARLRNSFDKGFKKAIAIASEIGYSKVEEKEISITWQDGLPDDPKEEAEIISSRTAGTQTMSTERALKQFDGMDEETAKTEIEEIRNEQMQDMPVTPHPAIENFDNGE